MPILDATDTHIALAAQRLHEGALVAFPTETVYGLGANACDNSAVAKIYAAKNRPQFNPLISHYASADAVFDDIAYEQTEGNETAQILAHHFWPGPMTLVLERPAKCRISQLASAGLSSVAVRVPNHPVALKLLSQCPFPVVAPSANPSGKISPSCAEHVEAAMSDRLEIILDGGWCNAGLESTVIDCRDPDNIMMLRPGPVTKSDIEQVLARPVILPQSDSDAPVSPGQLASHYAPNAAVALEVTTPPSGAVYISFGIANTDNPLHLSLSEAGDLEEAAANLFRCLHQADALGCNLIAVSPIPQTGLGRAINDRLRRAAAPR